MGKERKRPKLNTNDLERVWAIWLKREWAAINSYYRMGLLPPNISIGYFERRHGQWDPLSQTIAIGFRTIEQHPWHVVVAILKHEMAHQWVSQNYGESAAHGVEFHRACERLCVPAWAVSAAGDLPMDIPDWRNGSLSEDEQRLSDRTNKLLALAQSDNEHEAALAMQRVRELYAKYNLDQMTHEPLARESQNDKESVLRQTFGRVSYVSWVHSFRSRRTEAWQSLILVILDRHFFVRTISLRHFDATDLVEYQGFEVMGTRENVQMAEYVFHFLDRTVRALWDKHLAGNPELSALPPGSRRSEKRHFKLGVLDGFMAQIEKVDPYKNQTRPEKECLALVKLADRALDDFYRRKFPRTTRTSGGRFNPNRNSYQRGHSEGQNIRLHKPVSGHDGSRGKLLYAE